MLCLLVPRLTQHTTRAIQVTRRTTVNHTDHQQTTVKSRKTLRPTLRVVMDMEIMVSRKTPSRLKLSLTKTPLRFIFARIQWIWILLNDQVSCVSVIS